MDKEIAEAEIKYRTAKWIISNLVSNRLLSPEEAIECVIRLLNQYDPPTRCLEEVPNEKDNED